MTLRIARLLVLLAVATVAHAAESRPRILAVTASNGDYIWGAGATLARFIQEGWRVDVVQFGNGEKRLPGATQAEARLAAMEEGRAAADALGVTDLVRLEHKSGELGYVSSTEMRSQLFALIRGMKPRILFIPDPYIHYQDDRDIAWVGQVAEEAWGYSGGGTFGNELARMGLAPYGAPEVFYYSPMRPYRAGEGGETATSKFVVRPASPEAFARKQAALAKLTAYHRGWLHLRGGSGRVPSDAAAVARLAQEYAEELARTIGSRAGTPLAEEFNHVGPAADPVPAYALDHARPIRRNPAPAPPRNR